MFLFKQVENCQVTDTQNDVFVTAGCKEEGFKWRLQVRFRERRVSVLNFIQHSSTVELPLIKILFIYSFSIFRHFMRVTECFGMSFLLIVKVISETIFISGL